MNDDRAGSTATATMEFVIGGIKCIVYGLDHLSLDSIKRDVVVVFLLHGRGETQCGDRYSSIAFKCLTASRQSELRKRDLIVVSFDQRNHGSRLINDLHNQGWPDNQNHFIDMFSIQQGTSRDVSYLIDYIPSFLFPHDQHNIVDYGCIGVSLGGHATWMSLHQDERITVGVPIIACADYLSLMKERADSRNININPSIAFTGQLNRYDPMLSLAHSKDAWKGKKIMALSGGSDKLVAPKHQLEFIRQLDDLYAQDSKSVVMFKSLQEVKHQVPEEMQNTCANFIADALIYEMSKDELLEKGFQSHLTAFKL
ncbi:hypothetical protein E3P98_03858 [Wallemia ichthyophaga]|nr:hypothetical protein E3P98_03858 [Wallemia ichthyophaga]